MLAILANNTNSSLWWGGVHCALQATSISHTDAAAVAVYSACLSLQPLKLHKVTKGTEAPCAAYAPNGNTHGAMMIMRMQKGVFKPSIVLCFVQRNLIHTEQL